MAHLDSILKIMNESLENLIGKESFNYWKIEVELIKKGKLGKRGNSFTRKKVNRKRESSPKEKVLLLK